MFGRFNGWRPDLGSMGVAGMMPAAGMGIVSFMFFSFIGRAILIIALAWLGWTWLTGELTEKEHRAWQAAVSQRQVEIDTKVTKLEAETRVDQQEAESNITRADAIFMLVKKGIWSVEPQDPVEAETIDLINETRGESDAYKAKPGS